MSGLLHAASFVGAYLIESVIHLGDNMEAIEDVERLGAVLLDEAQIGLPHV